MSNIGDYREPTWEEKKLKEEQYEMWIEKAKTEIHEREVNIKIWTEQKRRVWEG